VNGGVYVNDVGLFVWLVAPQDGCSPVVQLLDPLCFDAVTLADGDGGGVVPLDGFVALGWFVVLPSPQGVESLLQKVHFLFPVVALLLVAFFSLLDSADETRDHGSYGCVALGGGCSQGGKGGSWGHGRGIGCSVECGVGGGNLVEVVREHVFVLVRPWVSGEADISKSDRTDDSLGDGEWRGVRLDRDD